MAQVINLDRPLDVNETRNVTIVIANPNLAQAKDVEVFYELHTWGKDMKRGYLEGTVKLGDIPAEGRKDFSVDYKAGPPGFYQLQVLVDHKKRIKETNEDNNTLDQTFSVEGETTSQIFFSGKNADLSIDKEIRINNIDPLVGQTVNFEFTVFNNSDIEVWGADVDMFVNDELVFGEPLGTFAPNSWRELVFDHAFSKSGEYAVKIMVDSKEAIPEVNESNNVVSTTMNVQPGIFGSGHKDVAVMNISLSKAPCMQGEPVTIQATVKNVGQDTLHGVLCTIRTENRPPFFIKVLPILDPGEEVKLSKTLPAFISGEHKIIVTVDGKNMIKEADEENNVKTIKLIVKPISKEQLKDLKDGIKTKGKNVIKNKVDEIKGAVNNWLRGL